MRKKFIYIKICVYFLTFFYLVTTYNLNANPLYDKNLKIVSIFPETNEEIDINPFFKVGFNLELDLSTINDKNILLISNNQKIDIKLQYIKKEKVIIIKPIKQLEYNKKYDLIFKTGLKSKNNVALKSAIMYQYYTISNLKQSNLTEKLKIVDKFPDTFEINIKDPVIFVKFNQPLLFSKNEDINNLKDYMFLYCENELIPAIVRYNKNNLSLELIPKVTLKENYVYTILLSRKIKSKNTKNLSETITWQFKIKKNQFYLTYSYPSKLNSKISQFDRILLIFSKPLNNNINYSEYIKILDENNNIIEGNYIVFNEKSLIFIPDFNFYPGNYQLIINENLTSKNFEKLNNNININFMVTNDD